MLRRSTRLVNHPLNFLLSRQNYQKQLILHHYRRLPRRSVRRQT
jgi:hypothetical protein